MITLRNIRHKAIALLVALLPLFPAVLHGQAGRVSTEENVRSEPNGVLLGRLDEGVLIDAESVEGDWVRFTLEGWVWMRSLRAVDRDGFTLVVDAEGGENIRSTPSGSLVGRLEDGTLLEEVERVPGWIRVRRTMWIWRESLDLTEGRASTAAPAADTPDAESRFRTAPASGMSVLASPDGDTLSRVRPGSDVEVLAREGNWARVRIEGWTWMPEAGEDAGEGEQSVLQDVAPAEVSGNPEVYRGRLVEWELQFVSLERAEQIRTDFYEGEPFLLTRALEADAAIFVYVAVPPERLREVEALTPLERVRIVGRIRVGAASLTGSPIVDLLELGSPRNP